MVRDKPGLSIGKKEDKLGMRGSDTVGLTFDDMRIPKENLCGQLHHGVADAMRVLERGRITISAMSVGLARGALEESLAYAKQRTAFGKPIFEHQSIQFMLADMAVDVDAARLLTRKAAILSDAGQECRLHVSIAKLFASAMATRAGMNAIQIPGGTGSHEACTVERYLRDATLCGIVDGSWHHPRSSTLRALFG